MDTYQGGLPPLYTRYAAHGQRGAGFLSSVKRFLIPIAKTVLPHVVGGVTDLVSGQDIKTTLKRRGLDAGKSVLKTAVDSITAPSTEASPTPMPKKAYKRKKTPRPKSVSSGKRAKWS